MSDFAGHFVWHELQTTDAAAAQAFYCAVVGWEAQDSGVPGIDYTRLMVGAWPGAGLISLPPEARAAGARTRWTGYVGVDDVDEMLARLQQAGGTLLHPTIDIPGIGRFAGVADPQGAAFALFQPATPNGAAPPPPGTVGTAGWRELRAADGAAAFAFYTALFGWQKGDAIDMGAMGPYQLFTVAGIPVGGIMTRLDPATKPSWLYYFNSVDIDDAAKRVVTHDGQVSAGPHQVPGGSWIIQCIDPQGGPFALVAPAR